VSRTQKRSRLQGSELSVGGKTGRRVSDVVRSTEDSDAERTEAADADVTASDVVDAANAPFSKQSICGRQWAKKWRRIHWALVDAGRCYNRGNCEPEADPGSVHMGNVGVIVFPAWIALILDGPDNRKAD